VHVALGRVVAQDAVDHDDFLALGEPALLVPPGFGLSWRGDHGEPGPDADEEGEDAFDEEEPAPAFVAEDATETEEAEGEDGREDVGQAEGAPKEGEAEGEFGALEEVGLRYLSDVAVERKGTVLGAPDRE
jgi:hypothetical protein